MKYLITTIAAILLIGCGSSPDHSGTYILSNANKDKITLELKTDGSFTGTPKGQEGDRAIGSWKVEGEFLICEGTTENSSQLILLKFNKTTKKLISVSANGKEKPIEDEIPEGEDGLYLKKLSQAEAESQLTELSQAESQSTETVTEAANPEPPTGKAPEIPIHEAADLGEIEAVKQHLAAGTDVNAKEANGETPLHLAAATGHKKIVELLIANGADVNAKDDVGWTPLMVPATKEIAELLIAKGADVNAKDDNGDTALDSAIKYKQTEITDLLRKHGAKTGEELKAKGK